MKVNQQNTQHGSAAALALVLEIRRINDGIRFGKTGVKEETKKTLHAYFDGYGRASSAAKRGFLRVFGDQIASAAAGCIASDPAEFYSRSQWHGGKPGPSARECAAHARAWLNGVAPGTTAAAKRGAK